MTQAKFQRLSRKKRLHALRNLSAVACACHSATIAPPTYRSH